MKTLIVLKFLKIYRDQKNYRIMVHIQAITGLIWKKKFNLSIYVVYIFYLQVTKTVELKLCIANNIYQCTASGNVILKLLTFLYLFRKYNSLATDDKYFTTKQCPFSLLFCEGFINLRFQFIHLKETFYFSSNVHGLPNMKSFCPNLHSVFPTEFIFL